MLGTSGGVPLFFWGDDSGMSMISFQKMFYESSNFCKIDYEHLIPTISFLWNILWIIPTMEEILHQLRLVVYPIVYKVFFISGGDRRISEPSTVSFRWSFLLSSDSHLRRLACAESQLGAEHAGDLVTDLDRFGGCFFQQDGPPLVTHRIHAWHIYLYLVSYRGKCIYIYTQYIINGSYGIINEL